VARGWIIRSSRERRRKYPEDNSGCSRSAPAGPPPPPPPSRKCCGKGRRTVIAAMEIVRRKKQHNCTRRSFPQIQIIPTTAWNSSRICSAESRPLGDSSSWFRCMTRQVQAESVIRELERAAKLPNRIEPEDALTLSFPPPHLPPPSPQTTRIIGPQTGGNDSTNWVAPRLQTFPPPPPRRPSLPPPFSLSHAKNDLPAQRLRARTTQIAEPPRTQIQGSFWLTPQTDAHPNTHRKRSFARNSPLPRRELPVHCFA